MIRAIVFDVDGTMAETEELHRRAFNEAFAERGLGWIWDRPTYARLLATTGGRERIAAHASSLGMTVDAASIHRCKTDIYKRLLRDGGIEERFQRLDCTACGLSRKAGCSRVMYAVHLSSVRSDHPSVGPPTHDTGLSHRNDAIGQTLLSHYFKGS